MATKNDVTDQLYAAAPLRRGEGRTTFMSMISSVGAVLAACSCCVLPMALAGVGLSAGLSTALSSLGSLRWPMTVFSVVAVTASWLIILRQQRPEGGCASRTALAWLLRPRIIALVVATILTLVAIAWSFIEPTMMNVLM